LKYGVVYPCGAVVISDRLFVYYGGADMVTCVATAKMSEFMTHLSYEREEVAVSYPLRPNPDFTVITKEHIEGFCMKCRKKVEIKNPFHFIMKNLRHAVHGICPKCGTKIVKFGKD
jgi:DNA-directed RNA polymerase subunit RPC12/RpoP